MRLKQPEGDVVDECEADEAIPSFRLSASIASPANAAISAKSISKNGLSKVDSNSGRSSDPTCQKVVLPCGDQYLELVM